MSSIFEYLALMDDDYLAELRDDWDSYEEDGSEENTALQKRAYAMMNEYGSYRDEVSYWMKEIALEAYRVGLRRLTEGSTAPSNPSS